MILASPGLEWDPISKITKVKGAGGGEGGCVVKVIEHLPSKCESLSSNPSTAKKNFF
jgi:hypothetical protein